MRTRQLCNLRAPPRPGRCAMTRRILIFAGSESRRWPCCSAARRRPASDELPYYTGADLTPQRLSAADAAGAHRVGPFALQNQDGATITRDSVADRVYVANFFFSGCRQICPTLRTAMARVQQVYATDARVLLLSHSVAPDLDSVDVRKQVRRCERRLQWPLAPVTRRARRRRPPVAGFLLHGTGRPDGKYGGRPRAHGAAGAGGWRPHPRGLQRHGRL
jgi:hypothetical protein